MKKFKLFAAAFLASSLVLSGCNLLTPKKGGKGSSSGTPTDTSGQSGDTVAVTGVSLNKNSLSLKVNASETLTATVNPSNATNKDVTWESSNTAIATVSNGTVKGVAKGSATITVKTSDGNFTATCSVTVSENTPAVTDWTAAQKKIMTDNLDGATIPFISGTWDWAFATDGDGNPCVIGSSTDATVAAAQAAFNAAKWTDLGSDGDGDEWYGIETTNGSVEAVAYEYSTYSCYLMAWFVEPQEQTTDTDWSADMKEIMHHVLGGTEELPFYAFGQYYGIYNYDDFGFEFYDSFTTDLTAEFVKLLPAKGYTVLSGDDGYTATKSNTDGTSITLEIYFYSGYGNCIDATFNPVKTKSSIWPSAFLHDVEEASGYTVPEFTSTEYSTYSRYGVYYVEGFETEDISETYAEAVAPLGLIDNNGNAANWEETFSLKYSALYKIDWTALSVNYYGFKVSAAVTEPTSQFSDEWPTSIVSGYLADFELEVAVPSLTNSTSKKVKIFEQPYEEVYAEYLDYYAEDIEAGDMTEEEVAEYAWAASGLYISMLSSDASSMVTTYRANFSDTTVWEEDVQQQKDDDGNVVATYYYYAHLETGLTLCVYEEENVFVAQILEPISGDTPVIPAGDSFTVSFKTVSDDASAEYKTSDEVLGFIDQGADNVSSASDITKVFAGKSGLKFSSSSVNGKVTFNFSIPLQNVSTISFSAVQFKLGEACSLKMYVNGDSTNSVTYSHDKNDEDTQSGTKTLTVNGNVSSITFEATKRVYLTGFTVNF